MGLPAEEHILIVEDDQFTIVLMSVLLKNQGYRVSICKDGGEAIEFLQKEIPSLVLLDINMPRVSGYKTLQWIRSNPKTSSLPVICVTTLDDRKDLDKIFDQGATDYMGKPIREYEVLARLRLHLQLRRQDQEIHDALEEVSKLGQRVLNRKLEHADVFSRIITRHPRMHAIFHYLEAVGPSSRPVLITGETGVGKELIAKSIHDVSGREGKFVVVNIAGVDDTLFSDTLFGHVKGAFTGALKDRRGLVLDAKDGTLFLDEIGDLTMPSQVKLLRLLQEREYYPLGADTREFSNARIICATHRDLESKVSSGQFRSDLYYRLRTHHLEVPPLSQRRSDIPLLMGHFVNKAAESMDMEPPQLPKELTKALGQYPFPGNVRELESLCHDLVSRSTVADIQVESFLENMVPGGGALSLLNMDSVDDSYGDPLLSDDGPIPTMQEMIQNLIDRAMARADGNVALAARYLGISRQALHKRLKKREEEDLGDE